MSEFPAFEHHIVRLGCGCIETDGHVTAPCPEHWEARQAERLITFVVARLDEDEAAAKATAPSGRRLSWQALDEISDEGTLVHWVVSDPDPAAVAEAMGLERDTGHAVAAHIARHDPARVLRDVEARRKILAAYEAAEARRIAAAEGRADEEPEWHIARRMALHFACSVLAAAWSNHPDYAAAVSEEAA